MACVELDFSNIFPVVKHHISLIERYEDKYHRDFSLSFLKIPKDNKKEIRDMLSKILRNSDIIFTSKKYLVIFSPGADWNVAYDITIGVQEFYNIKDKKDAIATYPDDGENAIKILENLSNIIHEKYDITINFFR